MNRRDFAATAAVALAIPMLAHAQSAPTSAATPASTPRPDQRLSTKYRFDDPDMDLFFMSALSLGPAGGLDIGQAFYIASTITDGDADSWVRSFASYGDRQTVQADAWAKRGWGRNAADAQLKAFSAYRSAWQFAAPGSETFLGLYGNHQKAFYAAINGLGLPVTTFQVPWQGKTLPGLFVKSPVRDAPVVLIVGGADTCVEDLFLSYGRAIWDRGYSVAIADLPGQGRLAAEGLYWDVTPEKPISAVVDTLVQRFGAKPGRIALLGLSLGGYFVTRAAGLEPRLGTVVASTPFPAPGKLFGASVRTAMAAGPSAPAPSTAALRSRQTTMWKSGSRTPQEFLARWEPAQADPEIVTVPFLSVVGGGDSPLFIAQARDWHARIHSKRKDFVMLDAATGADGHCQVNARVRLVQEACGWIGDVFGVKA
jgi:pimeloyl-ACP methyl ester carboxylesterase